MRLSILLTVVLTGCLLERSLTGGGDGGGGGSGGVGGCQDSSECTPSNPCVSSACAGGTCVEAPIADMQPCSTMAGFCIGGDCVECLTSGDCSDPTPLCLMNDCVSATCQDGMKSGMETDVDCGGPCLPCPIGDDCLVDDDCGSGVCNVGKCEPCVANGDCDPSSYCALGGLCEAKLPNGSACDEATDCGSNVCHALDGVCCDTACDGNCESCLAAHHAGTPSGACAPVDAGPDPYGACPAGNPCGTAACSGTGASCAPAPQGTPCGSPTCNDVASAGTLTSPVCDLAGGCALVQTSCGAYLCAGASCGVSCNGNAECANGYFCFQGTCNLPQPLGQPCDDDDECASGACVKQGVEATGVCCSNACSMTCQSCRAAHTGLAEGTCGTIMAGTDPYSECNGANNCPC